MSNAVSPPDFYTRKNAVRQSFSRAAATYDLAAVLQKEVAARLDEQLEWVKLQPQRILDVGSGTGFGEALLRQRYPKAGVIELDLAMGMLQEARRKRSWRQWLPGRPRQLCADMEQLPLADACVDMLWSSLALQWCNEPDQAFAEMRRVLRPDGLLVFATLGPDSLQELRQAFAGIDAAVHVNRFVDMHDLGDALVRAGFSAPVMSMEKLVLHYATAQDAMRDLKSIGAHNMTAGRRQALLGKTAWSQVLRQYEALRGADNKLPLTFEVVYGHAWAPQPRLLPQGTSIVTVHKK